MKNIESKRIKSTSVAEAIMSLTAPDIFEMACNAVENNDPDLWKDACKKAKIPGNMIDPIWMTVKYTESLKELGPIDW
jgi:hypothetical protein